MKKTIRQDEWQAAYEAAMRGDPGESIGEIAARIGTTKAVTMTWLDRLVRDGVATQGCAIRHGKRVKVYQLKGGL